jgi:hypothetical protein
MIVRMTLVLPDDATPVELAYALYRLSCQMDLQTTLDQNDGRELALRSMPVNFVRVPGSDAGNAVAEYVGNLIVEPQKS